MENFINMFTTMIAIAITFYWGSYNIMVITDNEVLKDPTILEQPSSDPLAKALIERDEVVFLDRMEEEK